MTYLEIEKHPYWKRYAHLRLTDAEVRQLQKMEKGERAQVIARLEYEHERKNRRNYRRPLTQK